MAELPFNIVKKDLEWYVQLHALNHARKRVNSYEASEGLRTLQIHVLFYDLSFYFVIVQVAVI